MFYVHQLVAKCVFQLFGCDISVIFHWKQDLEEEIAICELEKQNNDLKNAKTLSCLFSLAIVWDINSVTVTNLGRGVWKMWVFTVQGRFNENMLLSCIMGNAV